MDRPLISLLMPTRNEGANLQRTIDSLRAHTFYPRFEVVIQDDASDDGSCDFLSTTPYADDARLRWIRYGEREGLLVLRRDGPRQTRGEIFQFLDAHMCFSPYWLSNLYLSLQRRNFQALVGAVISVLDPATWQSTATLSYGYTWDSTLRTYRHLRREDVGSDGWVPWMGLGQIMITRDLYESLGGLQPWFQGHGTWDQDLCLRAFLHGYDCHIEPTAMLGHYYKNTFINRVTWADVALNYFVLLYLNRGETHFERLHITQPYGYTDGMAAFEQIRPDLERVRAELVRRQRRPPEVLLKRLARLYPRADQEAPSTAGPTDLSRVMRDASAATDDVDVNQQY